MIGAIERYIEEHYQKKIYLKTRQMGSGEVLNTVYVSDEELKEKIHIGIEIEEE